MQILTGSLFIDLFAEEDSKPKTTKTKKKTKKSEPKDLSMFDDNAPSIFEDPLNALGTS